MRDFWSNIPWAALAAGAVGGLLSGTLVPAVLQHVRWLRERRDQKSAGENLSFREGVYWQRARGTMVGPFCPRCFDSDGKLIRLHQGYMPTYRWYCLACRTGFGPKR